MELLKKIFEFVDSLLPEDDKVKHHFIGTYIYTISIVSISIASLLFKWELSFAWNAVISFIITVVAGFTKEWYNSQEEENEWSWWDIFHTIVLSFIFTVIILIYTL